MRDVVGKEIDRASIEFGSELGSGEFGSVFEGAALCWGASCPPVLVCLAQFPLCPWPPACGPRPPIAHTCRPLLAASKCAARQGGDQDAAQV